MPILQWLTRDADLRTAAQVPFRLLTEEPSLFPRRERVRQRGRAAGAGRQSRGAEGARFRPPLERRCAGVGLRRSTYGSGHDTGAGMH